MKLLLTGFEPFLQHSVNPSRELVNEFPFSFPENIELKRLILPVSVPESFEKLKEAFSDGCSDSETSSTPEFLIMLGLANDRNSISLEKFALNYLWSSQSDNNGNIFTAQEIIQNQPLALATGFSLERVLENYNCSAIGASHHQKITFDGQFPNSSSQTPLLTNLEIQDCGLSPKLSLSAGSYVCNYLYYRALQTWGEMLSRRILFIHLPSFENESFKSQGSQLNALILCLIEDSMGGS